MILDLDYTKDLLFTLRIKPYLIALGFSPWYPRIGTFSFLHRLKPEAIESFP